MEVTDELKDYLYRKMIVMIASKKKTLLQNLYISFFFHCTVC